MRTTRRLRITLPNDMAEALRERVRSGEYASESEVIREGLRALFARDQAIEAWLRDEVAAAYDAVVADPSRAVTAQRVRARLAAEQAGSVWSPQRRLHARGGRSARRAWGTRSCITPSMTTPGWPIRRSSAMKARKPSPGSRARANEVFVARGIKVERVMKDNGSCYR